MNRTHLAAFHAVAEAGSFSRGAERLMVTQPAVSLHVADLEAALGARLFDRVPRGVRLTDAGELLLGYARRISALEAEAEQAFADLKGLSRGRLAIGASTTIGAYLLPRILGRYRRAHPAITLELEIANTETIQQKLADGLLDLGLTEGFAEHDALRAEVFQHDELVAIASSENRELAGKRLSVRAFCRQPLILRERGSGTRAVIEQALERKGIRLQPIMSLGSTEAIKQAVIAGIGVAIVSRLALVETSSSLMQISLSDFTLRRPLHLLQSKARTASRATLAFLELLETFEQPPSPGKAQRAGS